MRYFSMFSGIGGFELGIQKVIPAAKCIGFSEIDERAIEIYEQHFPNHRNYGDATAINTDELPDFDLLVGGFPCQAFSRGGKRKGFEDTRGTLFFDIARIVRAKQPQCLLLENVAALLDHDQGKTFETVLSTLDEMGYDAEWRVFDSYYFDAAPRQRIYVFANNRVNQATHGERELKTLPLYTCFAEKLGSAEPPTRESETVRSSGRIIRTFAKLPDWLDSWDSIYEEEARLG